MAGIEAGMVCIKTHGREAGKKCVVLDFDKKTGLVLIAGPYVKKRRCNPKHLLPLGRKAALKKEMNREELAKLLE